MSQFMTGSYQHNIDAKGRITVPVKLREQLGDAFYLTKGFDGCVFVYPLQEWQEFMEKLCSLPMSKAAAVQRHFISNSILAEADKMGRVLVPKNLREYAQLEKDALFLGVGKRAEIWSAERYEQVMSALDRDDILDAMSDILV